MCAYRVYSVIMHPYNSRVCSGATEVCHHAPTQFSDLEWFCKSRQFIAFSVWFERSDTIIQPTFDKCMCKGINSTYSERLHLISAKSPICMQMKL